MIFRPLGSNILVQLTKAATNIGKIILPDVAKKRPTSGTVLAIGPDVEQITTGQIVWFTEYSGHQFEEDTLVIAEEDVLAIQDGYDPLKADKPSKVRPHEETEKNKTGPLKSQGSRSVIQTLPSRANGWEMVK